MWGALSDEKTGLLVKKYRVFIFAGLLDVQNILSADTVVSPGKLKDIHSVIT
jgi:hypothetical protein